MDRATTGSLKAKDKVKTDSIANRPHKPIPPAKARKQAMSYSTQLNAASRSAPPAHRHLKECLRVPIIRRAKNCDHAQIKPATHSLAMH